MSVKKTTTAHNKKRMLEALEKTLGIVTTACKKVGVSRSQFYGWCREDEEFKKEVDEVEGMALDFAESKLMENIGSKKETSIIFYLKTKGKKRGYIEKTESENRNYNTVQPLIISDKTAKDINKKLEDEY